MFDLVLFGHEAFTRDYAERIGYPYPNLPDVGQLANYDRYTSRTSDVDCKEFYLACLKNHIFREAKAGGMDPDTLAEATVVLPARPASQFEEFWRTEGESAKKIRLT